jgi:pimeloyl-ACP methyl ester carboxylesterase
MKQPHWINKEMYPFASKWESIDGHQLHYIDEGSGEIILFVHGTPEWSFGFRDQIKELSKEFRCIAIDMLGFGLSDKPADADYTCSAHSKRLEKLIEKLNLKKITLVANDFGGGISLRYAIDHPDNIERIVLFNTWMWSLKNDPHYARPAKFMNSMIGKFLYLNMNFPVNTIMPSSFGNRKLLTKQIHLHYKNALKKGERTAAHAFAKEIMNASEWWQNLWERIGILENKPFLIFWGMKDKFIPPYELNKWRLRLPLAKVMVFDNAGHFVQEEKPEELNAGIKEFMK